MNEYHYHSTIENLKSMQNEFDRFKIIELENQIKELKEENKKLKQENKKLKQKNKKLKQVNKPVLYFQMPLDRDGNVIFDAEETKELYNQAVEALGDKYRIFTGWANVQKL